MRWCSVVCVCWPGWVLADTYFAWATHVSDGDTLWVREDKTQSKRKLRLLGIDAPELCQAGGVASREALRQEVQGRRLRVIVHFQDKYGRDLAHVDAEGHDVSARMVRQGQAWASRWHGQASDYAGLEAQAQVKRLGIFAQSHPEVPRDFRQRHGSCYPGRWRPYFYRQD